MSNHYRYFKPCTQEIIDHVLSHPISDAPRIGTDDNEAIVRNRVPCAICIALGGALEDLPEAQVLGNSGSLLVPGEG